MTTDQLYRTIHQAPFRPFTMHLADGRSLTIKHPDYIAHLQGGRVALVLGDDDIGEHVDLLLVVSIETTLSGSLASS